GLRLRYFAYGLVPVVPALIYMPSVPWRRDRLIAFLHPESDPRGIGFHITQSLIAVGTGGVTGIGLMEGKQKLFDLPQPHTHFIYAVASEEMVLIAAVMIATLFFVLAWRGFRTAAPSREALCRF